MSIQDNFTLPNKTYDVVLVGEILIDEISDNLNDEIVSILGGSTANIAINLKQLGQKPKFFGAVGNDTYGKDILEKLRKLEIDTTDVYSLKKKTTVVKIEKNVGSPVPEFNRTSDYHIYFTKELEFAIKNSKLLHFSYWPLSVEPSKSTILKAIEVAKKNGILIGFDPNYHIDLDPSSGLSNGEILEVIGKADIIKPSLDDSIRLFGEGYSPTEYINKYLELGCKLVIMTLGEEGLIASYKGDIIKMPSLARTVIDSTGAGDAFWGGLYTGLLTNETIIDSLRLGTLCSAYNLKQVGAFNKFPSLIDLKKELNIGE